MRVFRFQMAILPMVAFFLASITACFEGANPEQADGGYQEEEFGPNNSSGFAIEAPDEGSTSAELGDSRAWWRGLRQDERSNAIITSAFVDAGRYVGLNCKLWLQTRVVPNATRGLVRLPPTTASRNNATLNANGSAWAWSEFVIEVSSSTYRMNTASIFASALPGDFIQMRWRSRNGTITPHTMLIYRVDGSNGVWVIESNWVATDTVGVRWIRFADLASQAVEFNIYRVTGGW